VELLDHEEYARREILSGRDPSPLLEAVGRSGLVFGTGEAALRLIEADAEGPGPYDGITGPLEAHWRELSGRGCSPTALERYARCPFQYFGAQVLRLAPRSTRLDDLSPLTIGQLCHDALRACYVRLCETGWPHSPALSGSIRNQVEAAVEEAWAAYASRHGTGHALTGALARETVSALVQAVVETDQEECRTSGYQPVAFELETEGRLEVPGFAALSAIAIRGRLDRLDRRQAPPGFRVIDYKYRQARSLRLEDRDLVIGAIRAMRLQPPLYALMQVPGEAGSVAPVERVELLFLLPQADSPTERTAFESATWQGPTGGNLRRTLGTLLEGIHQGQFPMLPDRYCDHCDFTAACRRFHGPSWWRARSPMSQKLRKLRKLTVAEE
jgi:ATP-dependent helicase/nuclease subunit B